MKVLLASNPELIEGLRNEACPACGSTSNEVIGRLPRAMHFCTFQYFHPVNRSHLTKCNNCDLWYKNPCLTRKQLDDLYSQQPESTWSGNEEYRIDFQEIKKAIQTYNLTTRRKIQPFLMWAASMERCLNF